MFSKYANCRFVWEKLFRLLFGVEKRTTDANEKVDDFLDFHVSFFISLILQIAVFVNRYRIAKLIVFIFLWFSYFVTRKQYQLHFCIVKNIIFNLKVFSIDPIVKIKFFHRFLAHFNNTTVKIISGHLESKHGFKA